MSTLVTATVASRLVGVGVAEVLLDGVHVGKLFPTGRALEEVLRTPRHTYGINTVVLLLKMCVCVFLRNVKEVTILPASLCT